MQSITNTNPTRMTRIAPLLVIVAGVCVYAGSLDGPFIFDDISAITDNPNVRSLSPLWKAMWAPPYTAASGRPLVSLALAINHALGGLSVRGFHLFNVFVHIAVGLTLFGLVRHVLDGVVLKSRFGNSSARLAVSVAVLWVVHPLCTESVTYVIQRSESMMAMFYLLTLYCVIRGSESQQGRLWSVATVAACALGMGCKEVMVSAPLAALLLDRTFISGTSRLALRRRPAMYAGLAGTWCILAALVATGSRSESIRTGLEEVTPWTYALTQLNVIVHYLWLSMWPRPLVVDYDGWPVVSKFGAAMPAAGLVVTMIGVTVWAVLQRRWSAIRGVGFLGACLFLILAPSSSVLPIPFELAAERRMYLPLAAIVIMAVLAGRGCLLLVFRRVGTSPATQRIMAACFFLCIAGAAAYGTIRRNEDYRSALSIWEDTVAKRPDNPRAHNNLASVFAGEGRTEEAAEHYRRAVELRPNYAEAHSNLGNALSELGRFDDALLHHETAVGLNGDDAVAHFNLANTFAAMGRYDQAVNHFKRATALDPSRELFESRLNRARMLAAKAKGK